MIDKTRPSYKRRWLLKHGQGLVEFALILPVLLLTIFVIVELARVLHAWLAVENGARFAIRYAVTGEYNPIHCEGGAWADGNCKNDYDEPMARLKSIEEAGRIGSTSILRNESLTDWAEAGYFKVEICGGVEEPSRFEDSDPDEWSADWTSFCKVGPDGILGTADDSLRDYGGEEGTQVWVVVDFNHPLITPYLTTWWPQLHLTARRDGIVETFRTVRYVGMGAFPTAPVFTDTPTPSPTITETPTITMTPTITNTPTSTPDCSGLSLVWTQINGDDYEIRVKNTWPYSVDLVNTVFIWPDDLDPDMYVDEFELNNIQYYNGNSYTSQITVSEGDMEVPVPFNGDGNGDTWEVDFDGYGGPLEGYFSTTLTFRTPDGYLCPITGELTNIVPPTNTPTVTPTPNCEDIYIESVWIYGDDLRVRVRNNNPSSIFLSGSSLSWTELSESQYVNYFQYDWDTYYEGNDDDSPTSASPSNPTDWTHPSGSSRTWRADFNNVPGGWLWGDFSGTLTFDYICPVPFSLSEIQPTPTNTPTITRTPTITLTPPAPDCSDVTVSDVRRNGDDFEIRVLNNTGWTGYLINSVLTWPDDHSFYYNKATFNGSQYYNGDSSNSPTTASAPSIAFNGNGNQDWWEADFNNVPPSGLDGYFKGVLTFDFPDWGITCTVTGSETYVAPTRTPTLTRTITPVPSMTPTPTKTYTQGPTRTPTQTPTETEEAGPLPTLED